MIELNNLNLNNLTIEELLDLHSYIDDLIDEQNIFVDNEVVRKEFIPAGVFENSLSRVINKFLREQEKEALKQLYKLHKDVRSRYREQLLGLQIEKRTKTVVTEYFKSTRPTLPAIVKQLDIDEINLIASINSDKLFEPLYNETIKAGEKGVERGLKDLRTKISFKLDESPYAKFYEDRAREFSKLVSQNIQAQIREKLVIGIREGKGIPELAKEIRSVYSNPLLVQVKDKIDPETGKIIRRGYERQISSKTWSEMVARSETSWAMNQGRLAAYRESGLVATVKWVVATDPCPDCAILEGEVLTLDEADNMIPYHPHCKCTYVVEKYKYPEEELPKTDKELLDKYVEEDNRAYDRLFGKSPEAPSKQLLNEMRLTNNINVAGSSNISAEELRFINKIISRLPREVKVKTLLSRMPDQMATLKFRKEGTFAYVTRVQPGTGRINYGPYSFSKKEFRIKGLDKSAEIFTHEYGHCYYESKIKNSKLEKTWSNLFFPEDLSKKRIYITSYANSNSLEDFAECFVNYRYNAKILKKICPEKYEFMKKEVFKGKEYL